MSFDDDDTSIGSSNPREGYEITQGNAVIYRLASGSRDIVISGNVYAASSIRRNEIAVSQAGAPKSIEVEMPASHALVARFMANGAPSRTIKLTVWQKQLVSGAVRMQWTGFVTSIRFERHSAFLLVPARSGELLARSLSTVTAGPRCPHTLYDANCRVPRASFLVVTTCASVDGRIVTLASIGGKPDQWAQNGELLHVTSGERMTVSSQVGAVVTIQLPIYELSAGDQVYLFAGCQHDIVTCDLKFNARADFGGMPDLPKQDPSLPNGFGIITQS